ncbi:hypothetical protein FQZ97_982310 [compost metagenome]
MRETLVVIVHGNSENALSALLANNIIVKNVHNFLRRRHTFARLHHRGFVFLADDIHAKFDALVADKDGGPGNQLTHFMLAFATERAIKRIL